MSASAASSGLADATAAAPSSSSGETSASKQTASQLPSNPADKMNAAAAVEPQNPFEQVAAASPAHSLAANAPIEQATPNRSPVCTRETVNPPISPERSVGTPASIPSTPAAPSITAPNLSPAPATPTTDSRATPLHPRSAPVPSTGASTSLGGFSDGRPQTERRVPSHQQQPTQTPSSVVLHQPVFDDDENTEPSSEANPAEHGIPPHNVAGSSFVRFLENTRRRLSTGHPRGGDSDDDDDIEGAISEHGVLICGYLQKFGRNGKWQTRWFETDGECLTYYKSNKRTRPLATLDLEKVRSVQMTGCNQNE